MMNRIHEALDFLSAETFFSEQENTAELCNPRCRTEKFTRWLRTAIVPLALAIGLVSGPAQAQAEPAAGGGGAGIASAVIAGVAVVSSWLNGQNDNCAAASYAAQWGSDCNLKGDPKTDNGYYSAEVESKVDEHCGLAIGKGESHEGQLGFWASGSFDGDATAKAYTAYNGQSHNAYAWARGSVDGKSDGDEEGTPGVTPRQGSIEPPGSPGTVLARFDPHAALPESSAKPILGAGLGFGSASIVMPPDWAKINLIHSVLSDINAAPGELYAILLLDELDLSAGKGSASTTSSWTSRYTINGQQVGQVSAGIDGNGTVTVEGIADNDYSSQYDPDADAYTLSIPGTVVVGAVYIGNVSGPATDSGASSTTVQVKVEGDAEAEDAKESSEGGDVEITDGSTAMSGMQH